MEKADGLFNRKIPKKKYDHLLCCHIETERYKNTILVRKLPDFTKITDISLFKSMHTFLHAYIFTLAILSLILVKGSAGSACRYQKEAGIFIFHIYFLRIPNSQKHSRRILRERVFAINTAKTRIYCIQSIPLIYQACYSIEKVISGSGMHYLCGFTLGFLFDM